MKIVAGRNISLLENEIKQKARDMGMTWKGLFMLSIAMVILDKSTEMPE